MFFIVLLFLINFNKTWKDIKRDECESTPAIVQVESDQLDTKIGPMRYKEDQRLANGAIVLREKCARQIVRNYTEAKPEFQTKRKR